MSNKEIKRIIEDSYDESKEETFQTMVRDFYSRQLLSTAILVTASTAAFAALSAYSAIQFFRVDQTREQIMYASLFIFGAHGISLMKSFAWQMLHRHSIRRDLKHMELRLAELIELLKTK